MKPQLIVLKIRPFHMPPLLTGARVVSHDFDMGDWPAHAVRPLLDDTGMLRTLYLWRIAAPQPKAERT